MTVTASQVFSFLEQHPTCFLERREIHQGIFSVLRRSIRVIVIRLKEDGDDESQEIADRLRRLLSEWLTVPVSFDDALLESVSSLGDGEAVERRWGREIRTAYDHACASARLLQRVENPARAGVREAVGHVKDLGSSWRIYCHRRARSQFESIFADDPLAPEVFLHSVKDYREATPFDVLIKVGPLRSKGWGSAPDALLSAPRFSKMIQIVWSGCGDEDDFGYDPTSMTARGTGATTSSGGTDGVVSHINRWRRDVTLRACDNLDAVPELVHREPAESLLSQGETVMLWRSLSRLALFLSVVVTWDEPDVPEDVQRHPFAVVSDGDGRL